MVETDYPGLLEALQHVVYPWKRLTIGVDGRDGVGKSTVARYLAWKFGMPAIETDLFLIRGSSPIQFRTDDLKRVVDARRILDRPIIIEGIFLLKTLKQVGMEPGYLIFVESTTDDSSMVLKPELDAYNAEFRPRDRSNFIITANLD